MSRPLLPIRAMFAIITLLSLVMSVTVIAALGLYVFRSWNALQGERPGSIQHEMLDRLDRIEMRLDLLSERLRAGEETDALGRGDAEREPPRLP